MIASLTGLVEQIGRHTATIDVGGVGYGVALPERVAERLSIGQRVRLFVHTHVREDDISLYAFESPLDRELFKMLISISGVGPKVALSILSVFPAPTVARIILDEDVNSLLTISGIGRKTAQRLILELREKVGLVIPPEEKGHPAGDTQRGEVAQVLVGLGLSQPDARAVVEEVAKAHPNQDFEELLSESLKVLGEKVG